MQSDIEGDFDGHGSGSFHAFIMLLVTFLILAVLRVNLDYSPKFNYTACFVVQIACLQRINYRRKDLQLSKMFLSFLIDRSICSLFNPDVMTYPRS